jgi:hypothetical protein
MIQQYCRYLLAMTIALCGGCVAASYPEPVAITLQSDGVYCHKKIPTIGTSDLMRPNQKGDDWIDYYGPCSGPTVAEMQAEQRRFESHRFAREFGDEG